MMPNENLTSALRGSLDALENAGTDSPLLEADAGAIDLLLAKFNDNLVEGTPGAITDGELLQMVRIYRAQALRWDQDQAAKKEKKPGGRKQTHSEALDISL